MASKPYNMVDLESGYAEYLKQYKDTNDGISYWESLLMAPTKQYESSLKQATATRDYDISGAYANWKQNQLKLMQSSRLGTGVKSEIGSSLKSAYENQYAQAQQQFLINQNAAYQDYLKSVNTAEEQVNTIAQRLSKFTPLALQYYGEQTGADYSDFDKAFVPENQKGYGIYDFNSETGTYSLSSKGQQILDTVFGQKISSLDKKGNWNYSFIDWLGHQEGYEDLVDLYKTNPQLVAGALGGERAKDLEYSEEEKAEDYLKLTLPSKGYKNFDDFENDVEKAKYYKTFEKNQLNMNKVNVLKIPTEIKSQVIKYAKELGIYHEVDKGRLVLDPTIREKVSNLYEYMYHEYYQKTKKYLDPSIFYNKKSANEYFAR